MLAGIGAFAQADISRISFDSIVHELKRKDDAAGFTYATLDHYLANPTEDHLYIFDQYDHFIWRPLASDDEHLAYVILLCNKGYYVSRFGAINNAADAYEKAWKIYSEHNLSGFDIIEYCLKPLGNQYGMLGDYVSAGNIIKNYLFIAQQENNSVHTTSALINLSIVYHDTGRPNEAIGLLQRALQIKQPDVVKKGIIYSNLARNYLDMNDVLNAEHSASAALQYFREHKNAETPVHVVNTYKVLSLICLRNQQTDSALDFIQRAAGVVVANLTAFKIRERAKLSNDYAEILKLQNKNAEALSAYSNALGLLLPGYRQCTDSLPDKSMLYAENALKETLDGVADLFARTGRPEKALECFELSFIVEAQLRKTYHYQEARLQQQVENRNRTERAIELLYLLYDRTRNSRYIREAFQVADRTKAVVLKEMIEESLRKQFIKHDTVLRDEQDLSLQQAKVSNAIVMEQLKGEKADVSHIHSLISKQTELALKIKSLQSSISKKYSTEEWNEETESIDIEKLQQRLKRDDAVLLEYFYGQEALYVFFVDENEIFVRKVSTDSIEANVRQFIDFFSDPVAINNNIEPYKQVAWELYERLQISYASTSEKIVIVPDGKLNYIPFDALLYEKSNSAYYASLPFLLKRFTLGYQPSATIYANLSEAPPSDDADAMLGMFPIFENSSRVLKHSKAEAENIEMHMQGKFLYGKHATKTAFEQNLDHYQIIHLSTHAAAGSVLEPPSIIFIDSVLYLPEIYGLQLNSDLLVLSACETGVGKLLKGEGALSLARGFQYAGVRNIIFSLWNANDYSTASVMSSFYGHYDHNVSKVSALRQAKLDYLQDDKISNSHKSPYYWAAFIYYGEMQHKRSGVQMTAAIFIVAFFAIILILVISVRINTRRKQKRLNMLK